MREKVEKNTLFKATNVKMSKNFSPHMALSHENSLKRK